MFDFKHALNPRKLGFYTTEAENTETRCQSSSTMLVYLYIISQISDLLK